MVFRSRRIRHESVQLIAFRDDVVAHPEILRDHACERFDTGHIDALQLFDPAQNTVEFLCHGADLLLTQRDAGETGDVSDSLFVNGHGFFSVLETGRVASNRRLGWQASWSFVTPDEEKGQRDLAVLAGLQEFGEGLAPASRLMGLDLGEKTIGIALSDTRRTVASPLVTRKRTKFTEDFAALTALVAEHGVGGFVIGLPLNMNGTEGPSAQSARAFARNFAARSDIPLMLWDERLSTAAVTRTLIAADASRKRRAELVDKMAAAWLLQGALDALHNLSRQRLS